LTLTIITVLFRSCPSTFDETQMFVGDPEKAKDLKVFKLMSSRFHAAVIRIILRRHQTV